MSNPNFRPKNQKLIFKAWILKMSYIFYNRLMQTLIKDLGRKKKITIGKNGRGVKTLTFWLPILMLPIAIKSAKT